ncbi:reverse transcriptase domain-containing protein [Tanacetum coccineum]
MPTRPTGQESCRSYSLWGGQWLVRTQRTWAHVRALRFVERIHVSFYIVSLGNKSPPKHPNKESSLDASAKLTKAELNERSGDADSSKDKSGPESPPEFWRSCPRKGPQSLSWSRIHTPGRANGALSYFQLGDEGPCSGGTKLNSTFITVEIENTSRTINIKSNKRPGLKKKPYPSPLPEKIFASATQQMSQIRKRSSKKQNFSANHEGNTSRKRLREQSEQWLDNEISFPSTPGCQLVDSPIILEALIEGFLSRTPLVGFFGEESYPIGTINLNVTIGEPKRLQTIPMEFAVVKSHSPYNVILGRTSLRSLGAIASTIHSMIKFHTANGIATMITKRETLHEFRRMEEAQGPAMERRITLPRIQASGSVGKTSQGKKEGRWQTHKAGEPDDTIQLPPSPPKKDTQTNEKVEGKDEHLERPLENKPPSELIEILRKYADDFAWTPADMIGIPHFIAEHKLKTYPHIELMVKRKRSIAPNIRKVVKDEVAEWLKAGIVRKNLYPLPKIDWKIESLMGFKYKCFLYAYKGYHKIQMTKKDEEKMAFHTDEGVFYYTKMPFGIKNAKATYQRLADTIFEGQMGRNLEGYVDDMVIKSKTEPEMIKDVEETLLTLKKVIMKLNPKNVPLEWRKATSWDI